MPKKRSFVKLGDKAFGFADPWSRFNISRGQIKELETPEQRKSKKIQNAIRGGHLEPATESEFEEYLEKRDGVDTSSKASEDDNDELEDKFGEMTKAALVEYYEDNYELSDDEVKRFEKLSKGAMVKELVALAE